MENSPKKIALHLGLFLVTFATTTLAGAEWVNGKSIFMPGYSWADFAGGLPYSVPFLLILTVHEFGHYFTALHHKVKTTLPYYIPLPPLPLMFGTLGAIIRLKSRVPSKQQTFDIGIAGPLAGFVVAVAVLWYGFATLPPPEYIFQFHPEYEQYGLDYAAHVYGPSQLPPGVVDVVIGKNLLFLFFESVVADPQRIPNAHELIHYPYLFAGLLALVFTSLNLLPIGQLDGGHVLYGLLGYRGHRIVASGIFIIFLLFASWGLVVPGSTQYLGTEMPHLVVALLHIGFLFICLSGLKWGWQNQLMTALLVFMLPYLSAFVFPTLQGYSGWLLFALLIGRFLGIPHPPSEIEAPLTDSRKILGWVALIVFIICFTPAPIEMIMSGAEEAPAAVTAGGLVFP